MKNWAVVIVVELLAWILNGFKFDGYGALLLLVILLAAIWKAEDVSAQHLRDELRKRREKQ